MFFEEGPTQPSLRPLSTSATQSSLPTQSGLEPGLRVCTHPSLLTPPVLGPGWPSRLVGVHPPLLADSAGTRTWMDHSACGCAPIQLSQFLPLAKQIWIAMLFSVRQELPFCRFAYVLEGVPTQPSPHPLPISAVLTADLAGTRTWMVHSPCGCAPYPSLPTMPGLWPVWSTRPAGVHPLNVSQHLPIAKQVLVPSGFSVGQEFHF